MLKFKKNIDDRKALSQMLSGLTGQRSVYTRAPLYAYEVGPYTIDREGDLTVEEADADWEVLNMLIEEGFILPPEGEAADTEVESESDVPSYTEDTVAVDTEEITEAVIEPETDTKEREDVSETTDEADEAVEKVENPVETPVENTEPYTSEETDSIAESEPERETVCEAAVETENEDAVETFSESADVASDDSTEYTITLPMKGHSGNTLKNLTAMLYTRAELIGKATGAHFEVSETFMDTCLRSEPLTVDAFLEQVKAHEAEHGKAIEGIEFSQDGISFTGFANGMTPEMLDACSRLACAMNKSAIEAKRVQAKKPTVENERYALRIWLIRIGMDGEGCKEARKLFMKPLSGHTAYRTEGEALRAKEKAKRQREGLTARREGGCDNE